MNTHRQITVNIRPNTTEVFSTQRLVIWDTKNYNYDCSVNVDHRKSPKNTGYPA
ncbi:hypothetical protein S7335_1162 [Synechococcus sp. PCC 7335]|nr:hypothetical protein S7335_1162 [Synechococcus sp. PCC 7335]